MKIYFFTSKLNFKTAGGSIEEFDLMMRTLQTMGHEVTAVTFFSKGNDISSPLPYRLIEHNIRTDLVGMSLDIYGLFKRYERQADFFHIDGHIGLYGAGLYRRAGGTVPVSAFFNRELGSFPQDHSFLVGMHHESLVARARRMIRYALERSLGMYLANALDLRLFISPFYQAMYEKFGLRSTKSNSFVIGDPIDLKKLSRENGITAVSYEGRSARKPITLFFSSRMAPAKGFDLILSGFARVKNKDDFHLILGGDGPEEIEIKKLARDLGIEKYIDFPGWTPRDTLFEYYKRTDVFIQVGWRKEGTSISLLYALAFGLPCIVPKETGLAWQAGDAALTVENGNHDELARAIERVGKDTELRVRLSRASLARLESDQLNHEKVIGEWVRRMEQVVSQQSASR